MAIQKSTKFGWWYQRFTYFAATQRKSIQNRVYIFAGDSNPFKIQFHNGKSTVFNMKFIRYQLQLKLNKCTLIASKTRIRYCVRRLNAMFQHHFCVIVKHQATIEPPILSLVWNTWFYFIVEWMAWIELQQTWLLDALSE